MTWTLNVGGHGTPNDEANKSARERSRSLVQDLIDAGQSIHQATFIDNEGTHDLMPKRAPTNDGDDGTKVA